MTNLFSTFDPISWFSLNLNWLSAFLLLLFFPSRMWNAPQQSILVTNQAIFAVTREFNAVISPAAPGLHLIPIGLFFFILNNNFLGLFPYIFTASSHLSFTLSLALPLWLGHIVLAASSTPSSILAHLVPLGTPAALMPLMVLIEMVSSIIRPLTLSVRLAANIIAGHLLLSLLGANAPTLPLSYLSLLMGGLILLGTLECAVSIIQAYVFSILSTLYLNEVNSVHLS